jgi:oxalate decarboxylase/phosphoglucose isomerase-like protein (cupin superfamily)
MARPLQHEPVAQLRIGTGSAGLPILRFRKHTSAHHEKPPTLISAVALTGAVTPCADEYAERLSEFRGVYSEGRALENLIATVDDLIIYEVTQCRDHVSDNFLGTTTMMSGRMGDECLITWGHCHAGRDRDELQDMQSGQGLLLQSHEDGTREVEMRPGISAFILPDWAHSSINTYAETVTKGMRNLVVEKNGAAACIPNPKFAGVGQ